MRKNITFSSIAAVVFLKLSSGYVNAAECKSWLSTSDRFGAREFFKNTKFGTVGISTRRGARIAVPENNCILIDRPKTLYVTFNHRNSRESAVGYVSFKFYGLGANDDTVAILKLIRKGDWRSNGILLQPTPWLPKPMRVRIGDYEAFYKNDQPQESVFVNTFGPLHGTPRGSLYSSWPDVSEMQPVKETVAEVGISLEPSAIRYVMHSLQRVTVEVGAAAIGTPPSVATDRTENSGFVISVYSPLNESVRRTVVVRFR